MSTTTLEKKEKTGSAKNEKTGFACFDPNTLSVEAIKFMKSSFDATFDNVVKIQDLNAKILKDMLKKGREIQADALDMVNDFIEYANKGRNEYRKVMEDGFQNIEEELR